MARRSRTLAGLLVASALLGVAGTGRSARAQFGFPGGVGTGGATAGMGTGTGTGTAGGAGMYANPYMAPAMNPFLNPYAALYAPANPQTAALYFFAASQSMGGIGSGQLSGTRPRPGSQAPAYSPIPPDRRVSDTPGAGAARYFNRPVGGGSVPKSHYNRFGSYYSANGH
jgi:hypothetical protein